MRTILYVIICIVFFPVNSFLQIVGTDAYIIGDNVEIGINGSGHEGAPFLAGSNARSDALLASPVYFGFVANPQLDGWGDYDGDFFTPGSPENGFGLEIGGVNYSNNAAGLLSEIPGSISSYDVDGDCISVTWDGSVGDIDMRVVYRLISTELYYSTEITLTNTGGTDYTDIYYYRNLDPDNNVTLSLDYTTQNTIVAQPEPGCEKALVTATQTAPWDSYIGLGAIGENFRVTYGGFANRDASDIWDGVAGLTSAVGSTFFSDQAISLAYRVEDLPAGESEMFSFTVVLAEEHIDAAISSLYYFDYVDGGGVIEACNPMVDTTRICEGDMVELTVDGPNADDYIWTWGPATGLSTTDGPITEASPAVTTEYTVTGTPDALCLSSTIEKSIYLEVTPAPIIEIVDPGPTCEASFDLTTLVVNDLSGGTGTLVTDFYSLMPDSVGQTVGLWPTDLTFPGDTVYVLLGVSGGCFDLGTFVPLFEGGSEAGPDNIRDICNTPGTTTDVNTMLTGADAGGTWTELTASGAFDPATGVLDASGLPAGDYIFRYIVSSGLCAEDTAEMTVTILPNPTIDAGPDLEICIGEITTMAAAGGISYLWDGGAIDGLPISPAATTTYTVVGMDAEGCMGTDDMTITVNPLPDISAGLDVSVCDGEMVTLTASGGVTYVWTGGVVDGAEFAPPMGDSDYMVTGTDANGCVNTDEVTVEVFPLPDVNAADDFTVCEGTAISLTATGAPTLTWDGGVIDGDSFMPTGTTTYTVTGVDENGCANTDEIIVTVATLPDISFSADVLSGCSPLNVNFTNTTVPIGTDCKWTIDGSVLEGCSTVSYTFNSSGCFDIALEMTTDEGCTTARTYHDYICIDEYPDASFYASPSEMEALNSTTTLNNTSVGADSYWWNLGDGTSGITTESPEHTYPQEEGSYNIMLIAYSTNGCADTATAIVNVRGELIFYIPDAFTPDGDNFNETFKPIFTSGYDVYDYHLTIFNRWGEIVFESYNAAVGWNGSYGDLGLAEDGVYIWRIEFGETSTDKRRIKTGHVTLIK